MTDIPGLSYIPDFIDETEEQDLLRQVYAQPWLSSLRRRVQHYGNLYDYRARRVHPESYLGPLPEWSTELVRRLNASGVLQSPPDQLIVNEYVPGQGISAHVDCIDCFGPAIALLSLGSGCEMQFTQTSDGVRESVFLERRSLILFSDIARYEWQHAIPARKSDVRNGERLPRATRVSLTFRTVLVDD